MFLTILNYFIFSSAVLIYGIGLNNSMILCNSVGEYSLYFVKSLFSILASVVLSWLITRNLLVPLGLSELYPLIALLVFLSISVFFETMIRITTEKSTSDFIFSFLIVLLSLGESCSIVDSIFICLASLASFIVLVLVLSMIKSKLNILGNMERHGNEKSLVLISLAIIVVILCTGNASWLFPGVVK